MILNNTLDKQTTYGGASDGSPYLAGYEMYLAQNAAADARRQAFLDSIKAINLPSPQAGLQGIPSRYTQQQGGQQMSGLQPMQMYQNRNQFGSDMQPMQMLNQYRQTGSVSEPQAGMSDTQRSRLGTALGSNSVTGGK